MLLLYVPINQFLTCFFHALNGELVLVYDWEVEGAPNTVVNMLLPGFYHLQLFCSAAGMCRLGCDGEQAWLVRSLLFPSRPNWSQAHFCAHDHATTHFVQMLHVEQNTVSHFYNTRKRLWQVSGLEHPEGGGCKYHLSWRVFFCQEYWHVGPNNSLTRWATGNHAPVILTCENAFCFFVFWRNIIDMFVSYQCF